MKGMLFRLTHSITGKLVIAISFFTVLGTSLSLFTTIQAEKNNSMKDALAYITSFSDLMRKSIHHDRQIFDIGETYGKESKAQQ